MIKLDGLQEVFENKNLEINSRELLFLIRDKLELKHAAYLAVHVPPLTRKNVYGEVTYSDEWIKRYLEKSYHKIDPVLINANRSIVPIDWQEIDKSDEKIKIFFEDAYKHGVGIQGITIPIRGANGEKAFFSINSDLNDKKWSLFKNKCMSSLQLIANYYHRRVLESHGIVYENIKLYPRQVEVLKWISNGKSTQDVADIMNISRYTVQSYIESSRAKLNALNTVHAIARAIQLNIIPPPD